ncbi:transglutaminase-like cysteine peptidase [Agaribacter flavus]|uniref:Transglutaminase-like cysteine peptidase n=2 Tax=Agaribacter flavus TaxID=1902781 RepID=A0ABV7FPS6_9ALTE
MILMLSLHPFALRKTFSDLLFSEQLLTDVKRHYGARAHDRVKQWERLISNNKPLSVEDKLHNVNNFFNRVNFVHDINHWGQRDYWATPIEFLGTNAGDCEDFTIAKYFTLISSGVPKEKLRLMYVTATRPTRQAHMVLAYYEQANSIPLVLDNINKRILPASKRTDLIPVYSFNGEGLWLAKSVGQGRKMRGNNNNKLWEDLNKRMSELGKSSD